MDKLSRDAALHLQQNKLIAAASIIGLDTALALIQAERQPFQDILDRFKASCNSILAATTKQARAVTHKVNHADFLYVLGSHVDKPHKQMRSRAHSKPVVAAPTSKRKPRPYSERNIINGVEKALAHGTLSIHEILSFLKTKDIIGDFADDTRKKVLATIKSCPKFSRGRAGNSYKLRTNARVVA